MYHQNALQTGPVKIKFPQIVLLTLPEFLENNIFPATFPPERINHAKAQQPKVDKGPPQANNLRCFGHHSLVFDVLKVSKVEKNNKTNKTLIFLSYLFPISGPYTTRSSLLVE